jgi:hypothetical protein
MRKRSWLADLMAGAKPYGDINGGEGKKLKLFSAGNDVSV